MAQQAQETFVAELKAGPLYVQRGQVFSDHHEVVKLDAGRGLLFKPLDLGEEAAPKSEAAQEKAPVRRPASRAGKAAG